jgi:hypothetical protein
MPDSPEQREEPRYAIWLAALGHKPLADGRCEHRWKNRTTQVVRCRFLDGFRAALSAPLDAARDSRPGESMTDWTDDPMAEARRIAERFPEGLIAWLLADAARSGPTTEGLDVERLARPSTEPETK